MNGAGPCRDGNCFRGPGPHHINFAADVSGDSGTVAARCYLRGLRDHRRKQAFGPSCTPFEQGKDRGTLTNALSYHFLVSGQRGARTGLVHRLDGNTSGVIVVAKTADAHRLLSNAFRERLVSKTYITLVRGRVEAESGAIVAPIGYEAGTWPRWKVIDTGRAAETRYIVKQRFDEYTLLELEPLTGRTHQIRIHCAFIGHPVVGDPFYGRTMTIPPTAWNQTPSAACTAPRVYASATRARMSFQAPIPETFVRLDCHTFLVLKADFDDDTFRCRCNHHWGRPGWAELISVVQFFGTQRPASRTQAGSWRADA